ncbi:MAG: MaoC family dehydratase [Candidatus Hodarchaeota archaeon]
MKKLRYINIKVGQTAEYERTITDDDIEKFAEVSGDYNPVHMDEEYAKQTIFKGRIAHGMLSASFISTVLASKLPGPGSIYLKQDLVFRKPVRIGDKILVKVEVVSKNDEKKRLTLKTLCWNQENEIVIDGEALVMASD